MQYRREIDGLRAVAVLPVILFHAGFSVFSGGYVGVDVFFVISGYLITSILIAELEQGNFSIARFYERRARRILPALFVVMFACLPFAYMWMLPSQLKDFAQSLVAVVFFASNVLFWREDGYFAAAAELKPLLHTWSLAVEEQYYLLFPIFLLVLWRFGRQRVFWSVVAVAVLSLLLAEWGWSNKPSANFYLAPTRAWELLAGSICAFMTVGRAQRSSNVLSALGLALIVFAIFAYNNSTPFPSVYTLVPVVGTALVILFAAQDTWTARLLSLRGFVGIGLISYSAYLWHQPLFAFARLRSLTEPSHLLMAALAVASLLLAWATWYWVEQAFRKRANPLLVTRRSVFATSGALGAVFVAVGLAGHVGKGFEWRFTGEQQAILLRGQPVSYGCEQMRGCIMGDANGDFSGIAFVGDSHMGRYAYLLNEEMAEQNLHAILVSKGWCAPLLYWRSSVIERCGGENAEEFERAFEELLSDNDVKIVVLGAEWGMYTTGYRHGSEAIAYDFTFDEMKNASVSENPHQFNLALVRTITDLREAGKEIIIVGPVPEYRFDVPSAALRLSMLGSRDFTNYLQQREEYERRNADVFKAFEVNDVGDRYIDVWSIMCGSQTCSPFTVDGFPLYNDDNHLVREGMQHVVDEIMRRLM
ncbi:O-acetyltransferase OatA [Aliiroseovarius sp. xm-m-379]|uniref:acyltransferase family protein n=1 Tax=unclassified Aliiroseovarius TaxID=2623558 RepID=UPI001569DF16|nr:MULTISPECIES: acyltransferase family protein [unclassified Aliiroseovarius]NRP25223.1 O-acetyltransferase OatA [Aliiroseovarius sp. xm-m-379]NRP34022.1 O-acetyltransferase OatA [Aliiroseovarius sp. xm-a-104]NRQ05552.1 O-acetyltransferase OatA [Aliiroseovarius sp. xm-m-309]NRQ08757.1 O-acetyltransferase OatA [Aliiroseovarius sp. xm-v-201]NRQ21143.1 O-acetyltransferase OatA [Aliiroseovarius sp. xm-v-204]